MITNHNFFKEILKAVCLSVNWVPKLTQIFFLQPWSKNQFNAVRMRSLQMLAVPHNRAKQTVNCFLLTIRRQSRLRVSFFYPGIMVNHSLTVFPRSFLRAIFCVFLCLYSYIFITLFYLRGRAQVLQQAHNRPGSRGLLQYSKCMAR